MAIDFNRFTHRSQQAMVRAQELAGAHHHQYVEPAHLLLGLLDQTDGITYPLLAKLDIQAPDLRKDIEEELERLPKVYGGEVSISKSLLEVFESAESRRTDMRDDYSVRRASPPGPGCIEEPDRRDPAFPGGGPPGHVGSPDRDPGEPAGDQPGPRSDLRSSRTVRTGPDRDGSPAEARPGHWSGRRDQASHPGALATDQEQPGPHRRAGRWQDGHRRRTRPDESGTATSPRG